MKQKLKIALIGGTGKSGRYLLNALLREGYSIRILLRNPDIFLIKSPQIEIVKGDARNYLSILELLEGTKAVISTLGQPKGERSVFSDATKNVIRAMIEWEIDRYILITGLNVDSPLDMKSPQTKFATEWMKSNYPETTLDKQLEHDLLTACELNWTMVRLPMIELTEDRRKLEVSLEDCPGEKISAADLAYFLIGQLSDTSFIKKAPFIANK